MKLFNVAYSGNSYKVRLLLAQLGIPCKIIEIDILKGESRTAEFLKINPNGHTPVLDDGGFVLAESNAILAYLARGTKFLPDDRQSSGWFYSGCSSSNTATNRSSRLRVSGSSTSPTRRKRPRSSRRSATAAGRAEDHGQTFSKERFFCGRLQHCRHLSIAYTHVAHEGGFPLDDFPKIRAWIERVKIQPGFMPML